MEAVVLSCIVCRCSNQDNELECLYIDENNKLSTSGALYVESFGLQIEGAAATCPQYLCQSCELQMRLFQKLKAKAHKNFEALQKHFVNTDVPTRAVGGETEIKLKAVKAKNKQILMENKKDLLRCYDAQQFSEHTFIEVVKVQEKQAMVQTYDDKNLLELELVKLDNFATESQGDEVLTYEEAVYEFNKQANIKAKCKHISVLKERSAEEDPLTKIAVNDCADNDFTDIQFLDDSTEEPISESNSTEQKTIQCCKIFFKKKKELLAHRKEVHFNKHPCPECSKLLKTTDALRVHMKQHRGERAFKCLLCPKDFHQKSQYQYHMNNHYNVRNFKCTLCEKAFLAKSDLSIHMRSHKGERPYSCKLCSKKYLLFQHLKMHQYSHLADKTCLCPQCDQKFISPATLRTHVQSIHAAKPQYQCEYCAQQFRRKHHLETHLKKVHMESKIHKDDATTTVKSHLQPQLKMAYVDEFMAFVGEDGISEKDNLTLSKII